MSSATTQQETPLGRRRREADEHVQRLVQGRTMDLGDIDLTDSNYSMSGLFESRKTKSSLLPKGVEIRHEHVYAGSRDNQGDVVMLIAKKNANLLFMSFYTKPMEIGKSIIEKLKEKGGMDVKKLYSGLEWCGIDLTGRLNGNQYLKPYGWFANIGTCGGARELLKIIQKFSIDIRSINAPVNFTLAEAQLKDSEIKATSSLMNTLIGKGTMKFESDDDHEDDDAEDEDTEP